MKVISSLVITLLIISCENTNREDKIDISKGYVFLNQASISSIDYYDIEADSLIPAVYQRNNNSESLTGYAEHLNQSDDIITLTLQGAFGSGSGGKVIILNKQFEKLFEITDFPSNHNTLYTEIHGNTLFVSYRKSVGEYPNTTYSYTVRKYEKNSSASALSYTQVGSDVDAGISGYGFGRMKYNNSYLYLNDEHSLSVIDANSMQIIKRIDFNKTLDNIEVFNNKLYVSVFNFEDKNGKEDLKNGGFYIIRDMQLVDSLIGDFGFKKLHATENELFAIKWDGQGRTYNASNYSYEWTALTSSMMSISNVNSSKLFDYDGLTTISDLWLDYNYDEYEDLFLLSDAAYSNSKMSFYNSQGTLINSINLVGQTIQAIILK